MQRYTKFDRNDTIYVGVIAI